MAARVFGRIRSRRGEGEKVHSISVRLTEEEHEMLRELCERYKWNLSQMIQTLIRVVHEKRIPLNPDIEGDLQHLPPKRRER